MATAGSMIQDSGYREKIIQETHQYCRHTMQAWVQWFTFFLTVNYVALGWFAGELSKGEIKDFGALKEVAVFFVSQNILGITVSVLTWRYFIRTAHMLEAEYTSSPPLFSGAQRRPLRFRETPTVNVSY